MEKKIMTGLGSIGMVGLTQINAESINQILSNLNFFQLAILTITGSLLIDRIILKGWKSKLPLYIIKCPKHGYQITTPNGYDEVLHCPKCISL